VTVRVGVIGCGWWATRAHLPALAADRDAVIAAIADPDRAKLHRAGEYFGVRSRYPDVEAMLATEELDAAIVATPHASHAPLARACLDRGLHVLVEKPMTITPADAFGLVSRARTVGRELIVGYPYHYVPQHAELRRRLADGVVGRPELVVGLFASVVRELYRGHPETYREVLGYPVNEPGRDTYRDSALAGGGQGQTQLTHLAALALWLTGLTPMAVSAVIASFELAVDLVDVLAVRFVGGAVGSFTSTGSVTPAQPEQLDLRVFGATGHVALDPYAGSASIATSDGRVEHLPVTPADERYPERAPARNLVGVALGREANGSPADLGASVVALIDAAYRSARRGREEAVTTHASRSSTGSPEGTRA
jgi:predicted dehydrogenase